MAKDTIPIFDVFGQLEDYAKLWKKRKKHPIYSSYEGDDNELLRFDADTRIPNYILALIAYTNELMDRYHDLVTATQGLRETKIKIIRVDEDAPISYEIPKPGKIDDKPE